MGIPDGAHTHGHGSGGGVGTAVLILVAAALVSAAAWPVIAAVTDLLRIVLIITSTVAAPVGAAGIALAAWRLRHAGKNSTLGIPGSPKATGCRRSAGRAESGTPRTRSAR